MDKHDIRPDPDAVEAVLTWKSPKTKNQLMSFLGFANYYREFIKSYADKVYPLQQLMRHKSKKFIWSESVQRIKKELREAPVLGMPTKKKDVHAGYGCVSDSDLGHTPSRAGMEREDSPETDSIRQQSLE